MTLNNWKELYIGGNKLKKLVRASDGLVLFQKQEEYPNWICFDYLTPEITSTQIQVRFEGNVTPSLVYSYDRKSWTEIGTTSNTTNINFDASHQRIWIKAGPGGNTTLATSSSNYVAISPINFSSDNRNLIKIALRGNIFSLLDAENFESITSTPNYCFNNLFYGIENSVLTDASGLILNNGSLKCSGSTFRQLFFNQKYLKKGPETLPSIEANKNQIVGVFDGMFNNCTKLESCFDNINIDASKVSSTSNARLTFRNMFRSTKIKKMGITYTGTRFGTGQFLSMFNGCSELNQIEVNFTTWPNTGYMPSWVNGVSSTGTFICPEALPIEYATNRIPPGWTVVRK